MLLSKVVKVKVTSNMCKYYREKNITLNAMIS